MADMTNYFTEALPGDISEYDVDGDMHTLENTFVQLDTSRARTVQAWTSGFPVGVLRNRPVETATATQFSLVAQVQLRGKAPVKTGTGGLAVGDLVKVTTGGVGIKATPADKDLIVGQCEVAGSEGYLATVRLEKFYVSMT
jgi:hypothetical protein